MEGSPYCAVPRDDLAEFAAYLLDGLVPCLRTHSENTGDLNAEQHMDTLQTAYQECEEWLEHANTHDDQTGVDEVLVDRDGLRACFYGLRHALRAFQDRKQTCFEQDAGDTVIQMAVGLWLLLGLSDEEMDECRTRLTRRANLIQSLEEEPKTDPVLIPVAPSSLTTLLDLVREYNHCSEPARRKELWDQAAVSARRLARYIQEKEKDPRKPLPPGIVEVSAKRLVRIPRWILDGFFQSDGKGMLAAEEYLDRFIQDLPTP
ncbi:MAG: hypothetical protein ACK47B_18845 [Armatimonadota bacterium]